MGLAVGLVAIVCAQLTVTDCFVVSGDDHDEFERRFSTSFLMSDQRTIIIQDLSSDYLLRYTLPDGQLALRVAYSKRRHIVYVLGLWTNMSNHYITMPFVASLQVRVRRPGPEPEDTLELEKIRAMEEFKCFFCANIELLVDQGSGNVYVRTGRNLFYIFDHTLTYFKLIRNVEPAGIFIKGQYVYWPGEDGTSIFRASLDFTRKGESIRFRGLGDPFTIVNIDYRFGALFYLSRSVTYDDNLYAIRLYLDQRNPRKVEKVNVDLRDRHLFATHPNIHGFPCFFTHREKDYEPSPFPKVMSVFCVDEYLRPYDVKHIGLLHLPMFMEQIHLNIISIGYTEEDANACSYNNGGCDQLCISTIFGNRTCLCAERWVEASNGSCIWPEERRYVLTIQKDALAVFEVESNSIGYIYDPILTGKSLGHAGCRFDLDANTLFCSGKNSTMINYSRDSKHVPEYVMLDPHILVDNIDKELYSLAFPKEEEWPESDPVMVQGIVRNYSGDSLRMFTFEVYGLLPPSANRKLRHYLDVEDRVIFVHIKDDSREKLMVWPLNLTSGLHEMRDWTLDRSPTPVAIMTMAGSNNGSVFLLATSSMLPYLQRSLPLWIFNKVHTMASVKRWAPATVLEEEVYFYEYYSKWKLLPAVPLGYPETPFTSMLVLKKNELDTNSHSLIYPVFLLDFVPKAPAVFKGPVLPLIDPEYVYIGAYGADTPAVDVTLRTTNDPMLMGGYQGFQDLGVYEMRRPPKENPFERKFGRMIDPEVGLHNFLERFREPIEFSPVDWDDDYGDSGDILQASELTIVSAICATLLLVA